MFKLVRYDHFTSEYGMGLGDYDLVFSPEETGDYLYGATTASGLAPIVLGAVRGGERLSALRRLLQSGEARRERKAASYYALFSISGIWIGSLPPPRGGVQGLDVVVEESA